MAMYYQGGSEIQADGLQRLYLMNPNYIGYTDTHHYQHQQQQQQQSVNMFFLNSGAGGNFSHRPLPSQAHMQGQLVGVPLPAGFQDPNRPLIQEILPSHHDLLSRLWSSSDQNSPGDGGGGGNESQSHIPSSTVVSPNSGTGRGTTTDLASQLGFQRPELVSPTQAPHQGLSLSLFPQQQGQMNFRSLPLDHHEISTTNYQVGILTSSPSPRTNTNNIDHTRGSGASSSFLISNGMILGSKYLKVAQELLDEVVHVGKNIKLSDGLEGDHAKEKHKLDNELISLANDDVESSSKKNNVVELTTAQRQELQMKKAQLVSMLDEVDQRYRQYHDQIQMIATSFEQLAGIGSSKAYTQLALHTISKQFRCLKDAISGQIKDTNKTLGEEENIGGKIEGSKLKFVDHHLRQQRALQQLGMLHRNAWRPQRGLPERAVSVLRAWLFEHFLHPYPKDSDKTMLAKQTGLTRSQVSNWFINARVRLWKPMVEEMYMEEVKKNNQEQNGLDQENVVNKNIEPSNDVVGSKSSALIPQEKLISSNIHHDASPTEISTSTISTSPAGGDGGSLPAQAAGFSFMGSLDMENITHDQRNNKKPRNDMQNSSTCTLLSVDTQDQTIKSEKVNGNNNRQTRDCYPIMTNSYTMSDQRFNPNHQQLATASSTIHQGNGHVSLTLGLPSNSDQNQHNFLPNNQNIGLGSHYNRLSNPQASHHPNISYHEYIDFQNGKRYAVAQLLQDFVS